MGYESRFYVVDKRNSSYEDNYEYFWAEKIATFDMSCVGNHLISNVKKYPKTDVYIYEGDEEITEDKYGDPLIEIPINDMIDLLEETIDKEEHYRRNMPFLRLLRGFDLSEWNNLVVLHYGY